MSEEQWKGGGAGDHQNHPPVPQYGAFGSVPAPYQPTMGFPQPVPPPGVTGHPVHAVPAYYPHGYQAVAVAEGRPLREPGLPCCGLGLGWFLFIIGFFLAAIPWYFGAFVLLCVKRFDHREKPGYVACTIGAIISVIAVIIGATKGADVW